MHNVMRRRGACGGLPCQLRRVHGVPPPDGRPAWMSVPGPSLVPPEAVRARRGLWQARAAMPVAAAPEESPGPHRRSEELARVEAVLFLAREPLTTRRIAKLARLADGTRARALVRELRHLQEAAGAAVRVEQLAGGFQLLTRAAFGPWVRRLLDTPPGGRLSAAALETLAIVAYRQPVTRADVEAIRGVGSEEMLRQLLERDLVAVGGRADDLGRPNVYVTTRRFLAAFGLARIEDLPTIESFDATVPEQPPAGEEPAPPG